MFERRLRLFLLLVFILGLVLAVRAATVQVFGRDHWSALAASNAERVQYLSAKRGDLVDIRGRILATDVTRFEVAVNFCALPITPDADWLKIESTRRARKLDEYKSADDADARALIVAQESQRVMADLEQMWNTISLITGVPRTQIDATRRKIADDVDAKHDAFWQRRYAEALDSYEHAPPRPWYIRMVTGRAERPDELTFKRDNTVNDQEAFHTVVADLSPQAYAQLALIQDGFPQFLDPTRDLRSVLTLRSSIRRDYPFKDVAAHVIGHVGTVSAEDRDADPNKDDDRRRYSLVDRVGRDGLERLAEQELRGSRGQRVSDRRGNELTSDDADAGKHVTATIDVELQHDIQEGFKQVDFRHYEEGADRKHIPQALSMNGAAVVIDIATGEVRALVSVPTFDINRFDELYEQLASDDLNRPLANRALVDAREPGSSVKPIIGLGAATQGLITPSDTIHCEGYAFIDNKRVEKPRCWTMSLHNATHQTMMHPHPTGDLTMTDAIERSCNVYFLTLGSELRIEGETFWMKQFGLGQITGIGLPESRGLVPGMARLNNSVRQSSSWYAAIGQGPVAATPIQICNEMATIARNGVWVRPRLLRGIAPPPTTRPDGSFIPDRVDLHLDPAALAAVHEGMKRVVNSEAGTGTVLKHDNVLIAAKTGSATAQPLSHPQRNADGTIARTTDGDVMYDFIPYGHYGAPNRELPWYFRSGIDDYTHKDKGTHSWVSGYAPADHPQIAFAVYVEYGGSGGIGAGSVANKLLDACIARGYLRADGAPVFAPPPDNDTPPEQQPISTED